MKSIKLLFLFSFLFGCSPMLLVGQKPLSIQIKSLPLEWETDSVFRMELPVKDNWWRDLNDLLLDSIIEQGLQNNHNLLIAQSRIEQAASVYRRAQSSFYPTVSVDGGWQKQQSSLNSTGISFPGLNRQSQYTSVGLSTQWEIDVFGSIRHRVKSQKELYLASQDDYYGVMLSLCAQIASSYSQLRTLQLQMAVARRNIESQGAIVHITEARYKAGLSSQLDVSQAKSVYYNTKASMPGIESSMDQAVNTLAILMGVFPSEIKHALILPRPLPNYNRIVAVGIPANIMRRRPDLRAAEKAITANAAMVGASRSDYLPKFYLKGSIGFKSHNLDRFFNEKSLTYEITPTLNWALFQGMQRIESLKSAKAQWRESIEQYNQTLLTAVQEVENAMSIYSNTLREITELNQVVYQGELTLRLSLDLYKRGLGNFTNVLDSQRSLLNYQSSLVTAQGNALAALIQLYKSLGGGFDK